MKTLTRVAFGISMAAFIFLSCSDELDIPASSNEVIQPDFNRIEDIRTSLNGVYSALKSDRLFTANAIALGEWSADNLKIAPENVGFGAIIHEWDYTESDATIEATWVGVYDLVRRANFVVRTVDDFEGLNTGELNRLRAEALILKSLVLLEAHKIFGLPYENGSELSVVYVTNPDDILQQNPRITSDELFEVLKSDINAALPFLRETTNVNFVSKALAHGLLARIAAFEKDWEKTAVEAEAALNSSGKQIAGINSFPLMWGENNEDGEAIFKIALDSDDEKLGDLYFNDGVGPVFDPVQDIISLYSDDDIRLNTFFSHDPDYGSIISKFIGPASNRGLFEPQVMRASELILLSAEANIQLGNSTEALDKLNLIRSNRIAGFVSPGETGEALLTAIRMERRKELLYEGFRFSDLRRWNSPVVRNDCTSDECLLDAGDFKFSFPIPRAELFANENMTQNPGY